MKKYFKLSLFSKLIYLDSDFLYMAYIAVANLVQPSISFDCWVSARSQYLAKLLSWLFTDVRATHPSLEGKLPPIGIETAPGWVFGLQMYVTWIANKYL